MWSIIMTGEFANLSPAFQKDSNAFDCCLQNTLPAKQGQSL